MAERAWTGAIDLPLAALERWLAANVDGFGGGPVAAEKFAGGQSNPTYRIDAPSGSYVVRRKPDGPLLKSAHAVEREFRVQRALARTAVPVPPMLALCEDAAVVGTPFYVMGLVEGRSFDDPAIPEVGRDERAAIYAEMARVLAAIHAVDVAAAGLSDYGRPGNYFARQIERWTAQYHASRTEPLPAMDELILWLAAHQPDDDGRLALVHGDVRLDNLLFAAEDPRCVAVLDWELSTLGHPYADLAAVLMQWRLPATAAGRGLAGVDRAALGIPSDAAFVEAYCAALGHPPIERLGFYVAFAFFRMAAILEGVRRRALDGNGSNPRRGLELGAMVPHYAEGGLAARDG